MVKSVSCCCVRGSRLFSDLVTFYPSDDLSSRNDSPGLISLTVNCQSLLAKRDSFMNLIGTYHPDIIFGTESWLNPDYIISEFFPECYSVYHQHREDGYGGVFIAY